MEEEWQERQEAELEFLQSAYSPDEAWWEKKDANNNVHVYRRLDLTEDLKICLACRFPQGYPITSKLEVSSVNLEKTATSASPALQKSALDALPDLLAAVRKVAIEDDVEEALFLVFSRAEEWIQEEWPNFKNLCTDSVQPKQQPAPQANSSKEPIILGRRLIYSHHIISKIKRADIKRLSSDYNLTGYMKIGWPGLIIIEGAEQDCVDFYDEIRPWNWQYLVVRGEQQERYKSNSNLEQHRKFKQFLEVDDMSLVAQHCREVGLEALFRTSMKVYKDDNGDGDVSEENEDPASTSTWYAALIHVDHMNDGKGYRKWLRKTSLETDCALWMKQFYPNNDYTNRPKIMVAIGGEQVNVASFMKRWRTSRVDIDSKGKPCLERKMTVLLEGHLDHVDPAWEDNNDGEFTDSSDNVATALELLGGDEWKQIIDNI